MVPLRCLCAAVFLHASVVPAKLGFSSSAQMMAFALADAMIAWRDGKGPRPDIDLVKRSLAHNSQSLSPDAAVVLGLLLENDPAAASVLMATFQGAPAMARAQLIQFVQWPRCVARPVLAQLADRALEDRSHFVRTAAISLAEKLRLRRALPRLHALLKEARPGPLSDHITYATEADFLDALRKFYDWETSQNVYPEKVTELVAWKLMLRLMRK